MRENPSVDPPATGTSEPRTEETEGRSGKKQRRTIF